MTPWELSLLKRLRELTCVGLPYYIALKNVIGDVSNNVFITTGEFYDVWLLLLNGIGISEEMFLQDTKNYKPVEFEAGAKLFIEFRTLVKERTNHK